MEPGNGSIQFSSRAWREYTIVDSNIDKTELSKIFYEKWNLTRPPLLVSIASDAGDGSELGWDERKNLKRCMTKLLYTTGTWIISSGMHRGLMTFIAEDFDRDEKVNSKFVAIGIANLDNISQADELKKRSSFKHVYYNENKTEQRLDPNNTHFILVDKIECSNKGECLFRQRLEEKIDCDIAVLLVFGGGSEALEEVKNKLKNQTPVIVIKGTGQLADALAYAYQNRECLDKREVRENMEDILGTLTDINTEAAEKDIASCINQHQNLIIVHDITKHASETEDIRVAIFHALRKELKNEELKYFIALNLYDLAENIWNQTNENHQDYLQEDTIAWVFLKALLDNKLGFVKMLKEMELFRYRDYIDVFDLVTKNGEMLFHGKGNVYNYLKGNRTYPAYVVRPHVDLKKLKFVDLFICSVLMNYQEMAIYFWRHSENHIKIALTGCCILNNMATQTDDKGEKIKLQSNASDFHNLAIQILNECFKINERRTYLLLTVEFGSSSVMQLASRTGNKEFIAQAACQSLQRIIWHGELSQTNHWLQLLVCAVIPPLILTPLVRFKYEDSRMLISNNECKENCICYSKTKKKLKDICSFYKAPLVVFLLNVVSYSVFLMLFSYMMLVDLRKDFSALDQVLICWVINFLFEEVRQVMISPSRSLKQKIVGYIFDNAWNVLDVVAILLFMVGTGIRWFVQHESALEMARVVLAINLVAFFLRLLHMFSIHKEMGPKLVMISNMFLDLWHFVSILLVVVLAYAIASYSILYPNSVFGIDLIIDVFKSAYWNLYGELFLDEIKREEPECTINPELYNNKTLPRCPSEVGTYAVPMMLGIYILFSNILLLNLLIAMFSNTFQQVQEKSDFHWAFQRHKLTEEYKSRPFLPHPFTVISYGIRLIVFIYMFCTFLIGHGPTIYPDPVQSKKTQTKQSMKDACEVYGYRDLMSWENKVSNDCLHMLDKEHHPVEKDTNKAINESLEKITKQYESMEKSMKYFTERMESIEKIENRLIGMESRKSKKRSKKKDHKDEHTENQLIGMESRKSKKRSKKKDHKDEHTENRLIDMESRKSKKRSKKNVHKDEHTD